MSEFTSDQQDFINDYAAIIFNPEAGAIIDAGIHELAGLVPDVVAAMQHSSDGLALMNGLLLSVHSSSSDDTRGSLEIVLTGLETVGKILDNATNGVLQHADNEIAKASAVMGWTKERANLAYRAMELFTVEQIESDVPKATDRVIEALESEIEVASDTDFDLLVQQLLNDGLGE